MACGSCGGRGSIKISRVNNPSLKTMPVNKPLRVKTSKVLPLRPANNIDKRI